MDIFGGRSGHSEVILAGPVDSLNKVENYLEKRVKILYAGAAAEALRGMCVNQDQAIQILRGPGGATDWSRARDCIQLLRNVRFPDEGDDEEIQRQLDGLDQRLWAETVSTVEKFADVIGQLAEMMTKRVLEPRIDPNAGITISEQEIEGLSGVKKLGRT